MSKLVELLSDEELRRELQRRINSTPETLCKRDGHWFGPREGCSVDGFSQKCTRCGFWLHEGGLY
jgi:hypothetical protein